MPRKPMSASIALKRLGELACRALGQSRRADLLYLRQLEGFLSTDKVLRLYEEIESLEGRGAIAEIGSWKGKSTATMALAARRAGNSQPIFAIDHHQGSDEHTEIMAEKGSTWPLFLQTLRETGIEAAVEPLRMPSLEGARELTSKAAKLEFLLVDGAHDEESVAEDLEAFLPLMLPKARLALDDARPDGAFPGVYRAYERVLAPRATVRGWAGTLLFVELD